MARIEFLGTGVCHVGVMVQFGVRIGYCIRDNLYRLPRALFCPCPGEHCESLAANIIESAQGHKAWLLGMNYRFCYSERRITCAKQLSLNSVPDPIQIAGLFKWNVSPILHCHTVFIFYCKQHSVLFLTKFHLDCDSAAMGGLLQRAGECRIKVTVDKRANSKVLDAVRVDLTVLYLIDAAS